MLTQKCGSREDRSEFSQAKIEKGRHAGHSAQVSMRKQIHRIRQLRDGTEDADKLRIGVTDWGREGRQTRSRFERQQNTRDVAALAEDARPWRKGPQPACRLVIGYAIREPNYGVVVDVPWRLRSAMLGDVGMGCVNPPSDIGDLLTYQGLHPLVRHP